jgi:cytochrome d ubiquinol oxidase subunit I
VWVCSQAGWIVAEVGRQPWAIQDIMPVNAAVSDLNAGSVQLTFWLFALVFTVFLVAEISILLRQISKRSKDDIEAHN